MSQRTGATSCALATAAARSPLVRRSRPSPGDSTGSASAAGSGSRPGSAASCARSSAHGSRSAGVWKATSTSSGVQPKRSGAPPRCAALALGLLRARLLGQPRAQQGERLRRTADDDPARRC